MLKYRSWSENKLNDFYPVKILRLGNAEMLEKGLTFKTKWHIIAYWKIIEGAGKYANL